MKAATPDLMKFKKLQRKLGESRRGVIGLLEGMWLETARNSPQGDIGRFTNEEIAIMLDWDGDPDLLVAALVECRWLDVCSVHRLVVHDWVDHCPTYVKGGLSKQNRVIAIACTSELVPDKPEEEPIACSEPDSACTPGVDAQGCPLPILAKPNQAKPSQEDSPFSPEPTKPEYPVAFQKFWLEFPKTRRTKKREAFRRWKLVTKTVDAQVLIDRAAEYAKSEKGRSEFAVMPSVWLNAGMWEDDPEAWSESTGRDDRTPTAEHLANWNPIDGGIG